jgi:hypothetical protein
MNSTIARILLVKLATTAGLTLAFFALSTTPASANSLTLDPLPFSLGYGSAAKIATSNDGQYILSSGVGVSGTDRVFISRDYGTTHDLAPDQTQINGEYFGIPITSAAAITKVNSVSVSGSGQQMAVATNRGVYYSPDYGVTWQNSIGSFGTTTWQTAVSRDGSVTYRATVNRIWRSVNGQASTLMPAPPSPLLGIKTSSNGSIYYLLTEAGLYRRTATNPNEPYQLLRAGRIVEFATGDANNENVAIILDDGSFNRSVYVSRNSASAPVGTTWTKLNFLRNFTKKINVVMDQAGENIAVTYNDGLEVFDLSVNATQPIAAWGDFLWTPVTAAMSFSGSRAYFRSLYGYMMKIDFTPFEVQGLDTEPGDGSVTLTWNDPSPGDSPIIDYVIEYSTDRVNWIRDQRQLLTRSPAVVSGLTNGTSYYFRVNAINKYGLGLTWAVDDWGAKPFGPAQLPTINSVTPKDQGVTIGVSHNLNGSTFYAIEFQFFNASTNQVVMQYSSFTQSNSQNSAYLTNLANSYQINSSEFRNGTAYYFKTRVVSVAPVQPWGGGGGSYATRVISDWSAASATFVPAVPPSAPGLPRNLAVSSGTETLTITWLAPASNGGSPITGYRVFLNDRERVIIGGNNIFSATITGITNQCSADVTCWDANYTVGVRAINAIGPGPIASLGPFVSQAPPTRPSVPRAIYVQSKSGALAVQWDTPETSGGSPITGYRIFWNTSGIELGAVVSANTTSYEITSLNNYTSYVVSVLAVNDIGDSDRRTASAINPAGIPASMVQARSSSVATGAAFNTQPQFTLKDDSNQTMVFDNFSIVTATVSSGGILVGTTTATAVAGVVTFTNLGLAGVAGTDYTITYTVVISDQAYQSQSQLSFSVTEVITAVTGPAAKLVISQAAVGTQPGLFTTAPIIQITDIAGNLVSGQSRRITATGPSLQYANEFANIYIDPLNSNYVDTSTDTADFANLGFVWRGSFALTFSSPGLESVSQIINPTPGAANAVEVARDLANNVISIGTAQLGQVFEIQPEYQIVDLAGTAVPDFNGSITITSSAGTLVGETTVAVINGKAKFRGLMLINTTVAPDSQNMVQLTATAPNMQSRITSFFIQNGSYLISFNSNGATGGAAPANITYQTSGGVALGAVSAGNMTKAGFEFIGWGATSTATTAIDLTSYLPTGPTTLFAIWRGLQTRTISIAEITTKQYGDSNITPVISISADSNLGELSLTTKSTACKLVDGQTAVIEIIGVGICELTATLTGETSYQVATATTSFTVEPKPLAIIGAEILTREYDGSTQLGAVSFTGVQGIINGEENNVVVSVVAANPTSLPAPDAGNYPVLVAFTPVTSENAPNFNYAITPQTLTAVISAANQTISFNISALTKRVGDAGVNLTNLAQSSSNLAVTYTSTTTNVCTISGSTLSFIAAGSCSITAAQAGNLNFNPANPVSSAFTVLAAVSGGSSGSGNSGSSGSSGSGSGSGSGGSSGSGNSEVVVPEIKLPEVKPEVSEPISDLKPQLQQTSKLTLSLPANGKALSAASKKAISRLINQAKRKFGPAAQYEVITNHAFLPGSKTNSSNQAAKLRKSLLKKELAKHREIESSHRMTKSTRAKAGKSFLTFKVWLTPKR